MASNQKPPSVRPSTKGGTGVACRPPSATPTPSPVAAGTGEEKCPSTPLTEQEAEVDEPSDIEEGGLDLSVPLKPISFYIADKKEMLQQCFRVVGEKKLQKMLPDVLKDCSLEEIKKLCLEQLELMSEKKLMKILEGENGIDSATDEEGEKGADVSQQDNNVDSTSSLRESKETEGLELKQVKGEDSDALSINADAFDSDIEGIEHEEGIQDMSETAVKSKTGQGDDLQMDIDKSVNEILGLEEPSPEEPKPAPIIPTPPPEDIQPSAQQLELLELEMRARAIKALMKAGDGKKISP
uniref:Caspase activity and apoptosis inhibitor 1 n=1 Tax=Geotrypetes seraphini TaxID=260995 RepID=A0A6P8NVR9_GEOSA|nr:caspase activity and apoptosis inhibitor 1 [Geotrypetes seraphini]XP_033775186.1 caspase activity and apoptosis inhibitor 1 [Geotrypetes seraphini]XP_033775196.1 caspase activity and apoptosis inhibitor 1 [Geotrypetes seraphini]XP_033775205.1 caspase activity and apoptosis inhibitor 1 [Geotrypetes seraphini]